MGVYRYIACDENGRQQKGVMEADTPRGVRQILHEKGLIPLEVALVEKQTPSTQQIKNHRNGGGPPKRYGRVSINELALFIRDLASLVAASVPVEESLLAVSNQIDKAGTKEIILAVRSRVMEGYSLAASFAEFPKVFSEVFCATVNAGEQSGHLDLMLMHLADYMESQQTMRQKIQQALIYPTFMTVVSIIIVVFLLVLVVPKIVGIFEGSHQALPIFTTLLITISTLAEKFGLLVLILIVGAILGFRYSLKYPKIKTKYHFFLLKLPLIGKMINLINTARYCRTLGVLISAGVPALEGMRISSEVITNLTIQNAVRQATIRINEGAPIHHALKQTGFFQPLVLHLVANGVRTGRLDKMLMRAADNQERVVALTIEAGLSIFEPTLILVMGGIVLFIVLAILLPIFDMAQLIT